MPTETPQSTAVANGAEVVGERTARGAQLGVEDGHLECRLRHGMTVERTEDLGDLIRGDVAGLEEARQQVAAHHILGSVGVLRGVERPGHGDALAPAFGLGADDVHEQDVALMLDAERHPERRDHRDADAAELDRFDLHRVRRSQPSRVIASPR